MALDIVALLQCTISEAVRVNLELKLPLSIPVDAELFIYLDRALDREIDPFVDIGPYNLVHLMVRKIRYRFCRLACQNELLAHCNSLIFLKCLSLLTVAFIHTMSEPLKPIISNTDSEALQLNGFMW